MGAPLGNKNGERGRKFTAMLDSVIKEGGYLKLREAVTKLVEAAANGEPWAMQMLADRLDGRPTQQVDQNVNVSGTVEHIGREEAARRAAELLGAGEQGNQPGALPH